MQPTRRIASVSTSRARVDMDSSSSQDEGGSRRSVAATRVVGRPAGLSDFEVSDLEFPELSDGALRDLDIDPADWELGDYLGAVAPAPETQVAQVSTGVQVDPATTDAAMETDPLPPRYHNETQTEPEIRAGPPCGISADLLADMVTANRGLSASVIADVLAQRPVDQTELQVLRWALQALVRLERRVSEEVVYGSAGVWANRRNHREVYGWMRHFFQTIVNRPR